MDKLYRPNEGRMLAGVCLGLAKRTGISPTAMRIIWLIAVLAGAPVLIYLVLWFAMPSEDKL